MAKKNAPSFEAGFAAAAAILVRMGHIDQTEVRDLLDDTGYDMGSLRAAGADAYDLKDIERVLR